MARSDAQRTAEELIRNVDDVFESLDRRQIAPANAREAIARLTDQAFRQIAPAVFGLADQVQNAVLQGPSRAALQATDISTVEGARELNRLLRGDDAARDQNLVELQKQSRSLDELVRLARDGNVPIAN